MPTKPSGRPEFRAWVDSQVDPGWQLMPLTHITKGLGAEDIIRDGCIKPEIVSASKEPLAFFFYGRPAYRISGDGAVKVEAACPYCFVFAETLINKANNIYAFDTGAFEKRMYKHVLLDEMNVEDFSLETDFSRPNKIIAKIFPSRLEYFEGDTTKLVNPDAGANAWDFLPRAYLQLLSSPGRNEPDDRICSIEVVIGEDVLLENNLRAIVAPHTLWSKGSKAPWLEKLNKLGVQIAPYNFVPNRHPEHYHALLETAVRDLYLQWGAL